MYNLFNLLNFENLKSVQNFAKGNKISMEVNQL